MTLYEMTEAARQLLAMLEADDIDEQTYHDTLEAIGAEEKLLAYAQVQKQLEADYAAFAKEADRIERIMEKLHSNIQRMRTAQAEFLRASGTKKIKAGTFEISLRTWQHVEVDDEAQIPAEFMRTKPAETHPDKKAILQALRAGTAVDGVHIESTYSAVIR